MNGGDVLNSEIKILSSSKLRNNYMEISEMLHKDPDTPLFITKNGDGDCVVMSIELYNELQAQLNNPK